jgi:hypothetical protein
VWWEVDNARGSRPHEGGFAKKNVLSATIRLGTAFPTHS